MYFRFSSHILKIDFRGDLLMAYIKEKNGKTMIYEERTDSYIETNLGELLFDFLSLDFGEYDFLYKRIGEKRDTLEFNELKDLMKKYPKTVLSHKSIFNYIISQSHLEECEPI